MCSIDTLQSELYIIMLNKYRVYLVFGESGVEESE